MDIYSSSVRAEYAFAYHNLRSARARAHRHTTEQLVGRGSAQKKSYYTITNADDELVKPIIDVAA